MIDNLQRSNEDLNRLFNITEVPTQSIRYQQMYIYMHTMPAYLRDSLTYIRQVTIHMMDYVDIATTNILSPDILPLEDLRSMLRHIELLTTLNNIPAYIIGWHHSFPLVSQHKCVINRRTVPTSYQCAYIEQITISTNIWSF